MRSSRPVERTRATFPPGWSRRAHFMIVKRLACCAFSVPVRLRKIDEQGSASADVPCRTDSQRVPPHRVIDVGAARLSLIRVVGGRHWTRTSDLLHVKHFRLSAVLRAWEVERKRVSYAVTVSAGPGGGPPPRLPIHRRPAPAPHQLQVDARMLAPLKASPSQPTGKAAKRRRADIGAASEAVSLGMLRLVEQDVAGAGPLERRREPKPMSSTPPENSAPCPSAQPSSPRRHRTSESQIQSARSKVTWVG